jgi:cold shock CspA family protein
MIEQSGIVRNYNKTEALGYIENESGACVLFFKGSICKNNLLDEGKRVTFRLHQFLQIAVLISLID